MTEMMCEGCSQGVNTAREKAVDEQQEKETEQKREETENSIQWMQTPPKKQPSEAKLTPGNKKRKDKEGEWKRQKIRRGDQTFALPKIRNNHCNRRGVVRRKKEVQTPPTPTMSWSAIVVLVITQPSMWKKTSTIWAQRKRTEKREHG